MGGGYPVEYHEYWKRRSTIAGGAVPSLAKLGKCGMNFLDDD
jgi:hypothetical protein